MEAGGKIESRKISENEFSYNWHFCNIKYFTVYESPTFGTLCSSLSGCHLKLVLSKFSKHYIFNFNLRGCYASSKVSSASLTSFTSNGQSYPLTLLRVVKERDLKSNPMLCQFHLTNKMFNDSEKYIFTLQLKLSKALSSGTDLSLPLQENKSHKKSSSAPVNQESRNEPYVDNPKELIQDLRSIYTSGEMCDLEIRIGENILRAHKFMLCSRSPVFKKMMEHDCLETSSNSITITDCSEIPFKKFLMYLYTGEIEDRSMETVVPLYSLGDKYDVPALRNACSDILQNKLSESGDEVSNIVCDVLQLAELHNDMKLKDLTVSFIVNHFPVVSNKQSWKDLMDSDFKLTSEVLALVVTACQKLQT
ncbi:TD and POZ domain-containing protein 1-like [Parasteatoda tepidariorum]|uniref:TD and POZ domain-containing protein 1-like n=1 Tax=Parasteatoda tepidariorum TaxID=114398 RepID=UPI0039BCA75B